MFIAINRIVKQVVERRSSQWPKVRRAWLAEHPTCAALAMVLALLPVVGFAVAFQQKNAAQVSLPAKIVSVYDGDTLDADVTLRLRVRLLDCWAPEVKGEEKARGFKSRDKLKSLAEGKQGVVTIPLSVVQDAIRVDDSLTFGRFLARVEVDGKDLSEQMVRGGYATKTKQ